MTEDFIVGFLWAIGSLQPERHQFLVRYKDDAILDEIAMLTKGYVGINHSEGHYYRLVISSDSPIIQKLFELGWTGRKDKSRKYPIGKFNELEFIRGYCCTKSNIKRQKLWSGKYGKAVRIYGSEDIVKNIDWYIATSFDIPTKKIQIAKGRNGDWEGSTCYLVYQKQSIIEEIIKLISQH